MKTKFNFNSQIATTREQSERLLALGLKPETADMCWTIDERDNIVIELIDVVDEYIEPAWSLHRLIEMTPRCLKAYSSKDDSSRLHPYVPKFDYLGVTIENIHEIIADFYRYTDLFDNVIDCIEWLITEGYFNKGYLV